MTKAAINHLLRRSPNPVTVLRLWVQSGGRCAFCNEHLLRDSLTMKEANFSNIAHIVAASPNGPRGSDPLPHSRRHELENLILVCPVHHKLIDSNEHAHDYPTDRLHEIKRTHGDRIHRLTEYKANDKTTVLRLRAKFDPGLPVDPIHRSAIEEAIAPRYMTDDNGVEIDLTAINFATKAEYWAVAHRQIKDEMRGIWKPTVVGQPIRHLSVFALAPIPLLVALGYELPQSIPSDLYQRHLANESWTWSVDSPPAEFDVRKVSHRSVGNHVALFLSLSGTVDHACLPKEAQTFPVYELSPTLATPNRCLVNTRVDLENFRRAYQQAHGEIRKGNPAVTAIHLFAAVPAPVAVACGKDLLRKVHPVLHVYDFDREAKRYFNAIEVNNHD